MTKKTAPLGLLPSLRLSPRAPSEKHVVNKLG